MDYMLFIQYENGRRQEIPCETITDVGNWMTATMMSQFTGAGSNNLQFEVIFTESTPKKEPMKGA